jgi:hypothetical protein
MVAGAPYLVTVEADTAEAAGYSISRSGSCSGTLIAGQQATCTITMNDIKPSLKVVTHVVGSAPASSWDVSVSGTNVSQTGTQSGSESGVTFRLDAHASFEVSQSGPSGYDTSTSGTCSGSGLLAGEVVTCTFTYTEQPSPTAVALQAPLAPVALLLPALRYRLRGRRWRTTSTGR